MLFIVDMQNDFVDPSNGTKYVTDSEKIVPGIINRIKEYEHKNDHIFYTADINLNSNTGKKGVEIENNNDRIGIIVGEIESSVEDKWGSRPFKLLKPYLLKHEKIKKSYYAIPPEMLLEIQDRFKGKKHIINEIEFVGVETNICVLANAICVQSAFPDAKIIIDASLCISNDHINHEKALAIMKALGMEIRR